MDRPGKRSVSRNAILNLIGAVIPILVTLATVPPYLRLIGDVRFGVLALVWVFLGYFSLFEMGLGRATAKYIAELHSSSGSVREAVFWTATLVNLAVGVFGGLLLWLFATTLPSWVKADDIVRAEIVRGLPWLAAAVPAATLTSVLTGALEGCEQFGIVNCQQVGATVLFQVAPLAVAYWLGPRLDWILGAAVLSRLGANIPLLLACARHIPLCAWPRIDRQWIRRLFSYGAWVTVSGIVGPILTSLDRFLIGFVQGAQAVTYYAIPYNFANKFGIIPFSLQRALFPRFSVQHPSEARNTAIRAVVALASAYTPVVVVAILLTRPFFQVWIGNAAAARCTLAGETMLLGIWFNGIFALVPYALIQAQGRPDLTAKFHLLELPPFMAMLWVGIHYWGVPGAAVVLGVRFIADGMLLLGAARIVRAVMFRLLPSFALLGVAFAGSVLVGERLLARAALVVLVGGASILTCLMVSPEVAQPVLKRLRLLYSRNPVDIPMSVGR